MKTTERKFACNIRNIITGQICNEEYLCTRCKAFKKGYLERKKEEKNDKQ